MSKMNIMVTGGAGFIGSHLAELLLGEGHCVRVIDNLSTGSVGNIAHLIANPNFIFDEADLVTCDGLQDAAAWADQIFHLASVVGVRRVLRDPLGVMTTNMIGTEHLLRAATADGRRPRFIFASTSEVYGFNPHPKMREDDDLHYKAGSTTRWSYAVSKLAGEHLVDAYAREKGLPAVTLRLFNTIGPRQRGEYGMVVPNFVRQAVQELPLSVYGSGEQTRCFCDVRDTVRMIAQLGACERAVGKLVNVGNEQEISIRDLAELVRQRARSSSQIHHLSCQEAYGEDFVDVERRRPDLTRLHALIDFAPRWTLAETIDELVAEQRRALAAEHETGTAFAATFRATSARGRGLLRRGKIAAQA